MTFKQQFFTVWTFFVINMKRLFRDKLALFFTFLFPLIFLFVFGGINSGNKSVSFKVAVINRSETPFAQTFVDELAKNKSFKIDKSVTTFEKANEKMGRSELDATIELPPSFGKPVSGQMHPSGQAIVRYTQNNEQAAQTLMSVLQAQLQSINVHLVHTDTPLSAIPQRINERSLTSFDYAFTGLLGFAILGAGIFGPINVFPELKKMGILRRLHTTPLRVWQYFLSVMFGNAVSGLMSLAAMFIVAIMVFHLRVVGNYFELALFLIFGIVMILGIGLAIGGWANNERQAAPLANLIVFPMMFLTGTFFPRFLMPHWLQGITTYIPLTPVIDGARMIATEGKHLTDLGPQLGIMAIWLVLVYAIAGSRGIPPCIAKVYYLCYNLHIMARTDRLPGEGQMALFSGQDVAVNEAEVHQAREPEYGPSVPLVQRAVALSDALGQLNQANMRRGMQIAAPSDNHPEIRHRYGSATPVVVEGAARNEDRNIVQAKRHFAVASGMYALIAAGTPAKEAESLTREMWDEFTDRYGVGVADAKTRNALAKKLKKSAVAIRNSRGA
jgi:ABC-2 type transport system permease protein